MAHVEGLEQVATVKPSLAVVAVVLGVLGRHLQAGETRGKHDTGALALYLRHLPVSNQAQTALAHLLNGCEGDAGVAQRQQAGSNRQLRADVPCHDGFWIDAEFLCQVKGALEASQLWNVTEHRGLVHVHRTVTAFDEAHDVLVQQTLLVFIRDLADARFSTHQLLKGVLREHPFHARQSQGNTRDHVRVNIAR